MSLSKMPIIFVENMIYFGGKCSPLTFYDGIKVFIANKVLFMTTEKKPSELLTFVTTFVHRKYKKYFFSWCYYLRQTFFHHKYERGYYLQ